MLRRRDFLKKSTLAGAGLLFADSIVNRIIASPLEVSNFENDLILGSRQIHLDYHTSGLIKDIATQFDPQEFASRLKKAHVNSVTAFGRCHHGYIYYDTSKFPERRHPHLNRNLLKEQIEACHKLNIRVPVYTTIQWDEFSANQHPEWLIRDESDRPLGSNVGRFDAGFYEHLCILTPYRDFLKAHVAELFEKVPVDGLFLDIHHVYANANRESIAAIQKLGLDASNEAVRFKFYESAIREFKDDMAAFIRKLDKNCAIFFNGGHVGPNIRPSLPSYTHLELESLPSGGWGYLHFPLTARYARNLGKEIMGMTGKFHTSWGDFHSLKNKAALEFECFTMLALNAKCSVGDQLHPTGKLDEATYDLIGSVYNQVEQKEPWCVGATAVTDIGVFSAEEFAEGQPRTPEQMMGAIRILQEGKHQFDVVDSKSDISSYKVLIMPDLITVDADLKKKISTYLAKGGAIIASYKSGLNTAKNKFELNEWGVSLVGDAPFSPDFINLKGGAMGEDLPETELVMYMKGLEIKPTSAKTLLKTNVPYFNRTWEHFNSHKHTPSTGKPGYPAVTQNGKVIYFMHPIFAQYNKNAPRWCKQLILNALKVLLPQPLVSTPKAPSSLLAFLNHQKSQNRKVLHLLQFIPERRGTDFDVIEDVIPLQNVAVSLNINSNAKAVKLVPENITIPAASVNGRLEFTIPQLTGHQMIEV